MPRFIYLSIFFLVLALILAAVLAVTADAQPRILRDTRAPGHPIRAAVFPLDSQLSHQKNGNTITRSLAVQIGDSTYSHFTPQFSLTAWTDCTFLLHLPPLSTTKVSEFLVNDLPGLWFTDSNHIRHEFHQRPDNGLEWEMILDSLPPANLFSFPFESQNLVFLHQPPLTPTELASGIHERPDSVANSYAVYRTNLSISTSSPSSSAENDTGLISRFPPLTTTSPQFGTGKAFHIYRPKATDANGHSTWCDLKIQSPDYQSADTSYDSHPATTASRHPEAPSEPFDKTGPSGSQFTPTSSPSLISTGTLTLSLPAAFLATATFPVRIDPTFGNTTTGASAVAITNTRSYANTNPAFRHTAGDNERIDSIVVCWKTYSGNNDTLDLALYSFATTPPLIPTSRLDTAVWSVTSTSTPTWRSTLPLNQWLTSGTEYTIALNTREGAPRIAYDLGSGSDHSWDLSSDLPAFWSEDGSGNYLFSIYACYTINPEIPPSTSPPPRRRRASTAFSGH